MPITADFHLHTAHSADSEAPMESMIESAIAKGLTHMCITEHMDPDFPPSQDIPNADFWVVNTDAYLYDLIRCREKYASQISISFGIELGLQPSIAKKLAAYAESYDFDFIIGSTHVADDMDPYYCSFFEGRTEEEGYRSYFQTTIDNIKSFSNFDVYGHLDYVVRYGPKMDRDYSYEKYKDLFDQMLVLLLEKEKGIEINTGGLRKGLREANPCMDVLKRYRQLGGEIITVGSDAHKPKQVAEYFHRAADMLLECGFQYYTIYQNRTPEFIRL